MKSNIRIRIVTKSGVIQLTKIIAITNLTNIIIEGPVTLTQFGIYIISSTNIIIRNLRVFNASIYGILISQSHNIVIDHCTIIDASRTDIDRGKCIDLTESSTNITVSYNMMGYTAPI